LCDAEIRLFGANSLCQEKDVIFCTKCGVTLQDADQYCWKCGKKAETSANFSGTSGSRLPSIAVQPRQRSPKGIGQLFGLDPRIAFVTFVVDVMLNAGDLASMGLLVPFSVVAGIVLGYIVYKGQINWYGDDKETAKIKAIILGLLTAIPTPLPEILYIPAGLIGFFHKFRKKEFPT
jgi:hypothetical protein